MALIHCNECGKEMTDLIDHCPHCGMPKATNSVVEVASVATPTAEKSPVVNLWDFSGFKVMLVLVLLALGLSCLTLYLLLEPSNVKDKVDSLNSAVVELENRVLENELKIAMSEEHLKVTNLSLVVSGGVVTDKVVIEKATFYSESLGKIYGTIDIQPQPTYRSKFLGQGEIDLADREIRNMLSELIDSLNKYLDGHMEITTLNITSNNYAIAEYKDGGIKLSGE